jgi:hypothetical protein
VKNLGISLVFAASALPLVLERAAPAFAIEGTSRTALVLLPWLGLAGVPRGAAAGSRRGVALAVLEVGLFALPPLALALALDRGDARSLAFGTAVVAYALLCLWTLAAELAASSARARRPYALAWFALVPGSAALAVALGWAAAAQRSAPLVDALARTSPLAWLHGAGTGGGSAAGASALALAVLVVALVAWLRARDPERNAP